MNHFKLRNAFVLGTLASAMALASTGCNDSDDRGSMMNSDSSQSGTMERSDADTRILSEIRSDLADERSLSASVSDIDVAIEGGVVTLSGEVSDAAAKSAAERAARGVDGVQSVRNNLTLSMSATGAASSTGFNTSANSDTNADTNIDYSDEAADGANTLGEAVSDSWITTKVKAELLSDDISSGFEVEVDTVDGWVTLSGQLGDRDALVHIRNLVESVDGVRGVDISNLSVVARR